MVFEYLTVSKKKLLLTVKYSKTVETLVKKMWGDNKANGMTTGFFLVQDRKGYRVQDCRGQGLQRCAGLCPTVQERRKEGTKEGREEQRRGKEGRKEGTKEQRN